MVTAEHLLPTDKVRLKTFPGNSSTALSHSNQLLSNSYSACVITMTDYLEKGGNTSGHSHNQEIHCSFKRAHWMTDITWTRQLKRNIIRQLFWLCWKGLPPFSHANIWKKKNPTSNTIHSIQEAFPINLKYTWQSTLLKVAMLLLTGPSRALTSEVKKPA